MYLSSEIVLQKTWEPLRVHASNGDLDQLQYGCFSFLFSHVNLEVIEENGNSGPWGWVVKEPRILIKYYSHLVFMQNKYSLFLILLRPSISICIIVCINMLLQALVSLFYMLLGKKVRKRINVLSDLWKSFPSWLLLYVQNIHCIIGPCSISFSFLSPKDFCTKKVVHGKADYPLMWSKSSFHSLINVVSSERIIKKEKPKKRKREK